MLTRTEVKRMLNHASKKAVFSALDLVNLKDKERQTIELVDLRGLTQEEAAEKLDCSVSSIALYRSRAYHKIGVVWSKDVKILLTLN